MIALDKLTPGNGYLLTETMPGHGLIEAEVIFLRRKGPAFLFEVVCSTDWDTFPQNSCIVRLASSARRWVLDPLAPPPEA